MEEKRKINELELLVSTVQRLRSPGGCPWDRAQTHESLTRYLLEESYEVLDAIERKDDTDLREELGDLLLQVLFHAEIAREAGKFDIEDVAADEVNKMVRRHPHVFGNAGAEETLAAWEQSKSLEKQRNTLAARLDSVPRAVPALLRAQKLLDKFDGHIPDDDITSSGYREAILSAIDIDGSADEEVRSRAAGEYLLAAVSVFRRLGIDCEAALSKACLGIFKLCEGK